jgi:hypothetical protein
MPFGPVSWYGVDKPCADSGFAGTMMSQLTLAAVVVVVPVLVALALGHGVVDAVLVGVAVVVAVPAVVGAAVLEAAAVADAVVEAATVGAAVLEAATVGAAVLEAAVVAAAVLEAAAVADAAPAAPLAGTTYAAGEAQLAFAASLTFVPEWLLMATRAPTTTASPTGIAIGTAKRASGLRDRPLADRCLLGMQSTSKT